METGRKRDELVVLGKEASPSSWFPCHPSLMHACGLLHVSLPGHLLDWALLLVTKVETARISPCGGEGGRFEPRDSKDHVLCLAHAGLPGASPHGWHQKGTHCPAANPVGTFRQHPRCCSPCPRSAPNWPSLIQGQRQGL